MGLLALVLVLSGCGFGGSDRGNVSGYPDDDLGVPVEVYKQTEQRPLHLHVFSPEGVAAGNGRGAVLFFHGGGYGTTRVEQFERQAQAAANNAMVGIVVEYRVRPEGASRDDSVQDGIDAAAYVAENAVQLGVDPAKIALAGSSAGGDLVARATENNAQVAALALFNPAVGPSAASWVADQPVIVFHSREDTVVSHDSAEGFCTALAACTMSSFGDGDHGFFNDEPAFTATTDQMIDFLLASGW